MSTQVVRGVFERALEDAESPGNYTHTLARALGNLFLSIRPKSETTRNVEIRVVSEVAREGVSRERSGRLSRDAAGDAVPEYRAPMEVESLQELSKLVCASMRPPAR